MDKLRYDPMAVDEDIYPIRFLEEEEKNLFIDCECSSLEHTVRFTFIPETVSEDNRVYLHLFLKKLPFFQRLKLGIKYIFGYTSKFGHHEETIITKFTALKIIKVLEKLIYE